ncbi:hypothetical protein J2X29_001173 [Shewanella putrefaciens]|nr:hypothetical protein [Shewanella putrefaciens]
MPANKIKIKEELNSKNKKPPLGRFSVRTLRLVFCNWNYYLVANFSRIRADLPERSRK